jgi:hypothetical protein
MKEQVRKEAECIVISQNAPLRSAVSTMSPVTLLRNIHPSFRQKYGYEFLRCELITTEESKEFVKLAHV